MTLFLSSKELADVLLDSDLIQQSAESFGWKNFTISVRPSMEEGRDGFEIDVEDAPEVEAS